MKPLARWPLVFCESLLIALNELKINSEQAPRDLLIDIVATHNEAALYARAPDRHQAVIEIVQRILAGKDAVDAIAKAHLVSIDDKIVRLTALRNEVNRMLKACAKGRIAQCKVIDVLARHSDWPIEGPAQIARLRFAERQKYFEN
jgi:hypothetical protein